jgi:surface protein
MFKGCSNLKNLDGIKNWNTSNVNDISGMFSESGIISLDLSNWNISNVTSWGGTTNGMFANAKSLTDVNISNWVINNEYFRSSFSGCTALKTVNMTNMVINNGNAFNELFAYRATLTNVIGLNTITFGASLKNLRNMFYGCTLLTSLDLSGWNTSELTNISQLFYNCTLLTDINMSGWNLQNITENSSAFYNCKALTNFQAPSNINTNINFASCNKLTLDSLMSIINNLTDRTSITSKTCTLGSDNLAKLTDEQKAIATSKNWVLA